MASSTNQLFFSSLKTETLEKAQKELNEDPATRTDSIARLRGLISSREGDSELEGVVFERSDDAFLLRFLRARKFDEERALNLYINYYRCRRDYPEIFKEFTPHSVEGILRTGLISVLDHSALDGAKVLCVQPRYADIDNVSSWLILRTMLLVIEKLLEQNEEVQVHGVRLVVNYDEVEFMKVLKFSQMEATKTGVMPKLLQDAMPIRLKGIHLVKQPWYISIVLTILKTFMKDKMRERVNLHGYDFQSLHETFLPEYLPSELEGSLPSLDNFSAARLFDFRTTAESKPLEQEPVPE